MVDVGILCRGDDTPERMEYMRGELEASMEMSWLGYHIGMELLLPEPVVRKRDRDDGEGSQKEDGAPPLKRRRVVAEVAGDECPICLDELETGLAAWPGCSTPHVFHGECLQMNLKESVVCPFAGLLCGATEKNILHQTCDAVDMNFLFASATLHPSISCMNLEQSSDK
ncbi:hypothetical protein ABZP36_033567 [Zizania latifolia]